MIGKVISHYRIIEKLGEGGMGEVYLAEDTKLKRKIALKFLPADLTSDKDATQRFEREAQAAAALNHPNIIIIHEISEFEGQIFIAMEYVEGESLSEKISGSHLPVDDVIDIVTQICEGLSKAHRAGIVHRDIKPENILIDEDGRVKIVDFGLAKLKGVGKLTKEKSTLGTVHYMSPEQASGEDVDHRTDIWSLGVVLYEMLTGTLPFKRDYEQAVIYSILNEEPLPVTTIRVNVPKEFDRLIQKALAKTPQKRYRHINDLMADLQQIQLSLTTKPERRKFARRKPYLSRILTSSIFWIVIIALFGLAAGVLLFYPSGVIPFSERDWILITDFKNLTGEDIFDKSLNIALAVSIGQSSYINVFPQKRIAETLRRMRKDGLEHIHDEIGREIAIREGINVIVVPSISIIGDRYALMGEIQDANTGSISKSEIVQAQGKDEVLAALDELSKKIRKDLGESLSAISKRSKPLKKVTTSSLEALKQYSLGTENLLNLNFEEAKLYYENALQIDSNFTAAKASLGSLYFDKFDREKGKELLADAIKEVDNLTDKEKYGILAFHARVVENNLEKAVKCHKMRLALYPDDEASYHNIGWCYQLMGRYQEAVTKYKRAIQINPYAMLSYAGLSWVYLYYLGEVDSTLAICKRQISYNDQIAWTFDHLGWAYLGKDSLKEAQKAFERVLVLNPRFILALYHLAYTYRLQGQFQKAIEPLKKILDINETESSAHYELGIIYQLLGNTYAAHQHFETFRRDVEKNLQQEPNTGNNYIILGIVLTQLGQKELAWAMAQKGMDIDSTQHFAFARFLSVQGEKQKALDHLELAVKNGFTNYIWMKTHPSLQPLYDEPRFKELINRCLKR